MVYTYVFIRLFKRVIKTHDISRNLKMNLIHKPLWISSIELCFFDKMPGMCSSENRKYIFSNFQGRKRNNIECFYFLITETFCLSTNNIRFMLDKYYFLDDKGKRNRFKSPHHQQQVIVWASIFEQKNDIEIRKMKWKKNCKSFTMSSTMCIFILLWVG